VEQTALEKIEKQKELLSSKDSKLNKNQKKRLKAKLKKRMASTPFPSSVASSSPAQTEEKVSREPNDKESTLSKTTASGVADHLV